MPVTTARILSEKPARVIAASGEVPASVGAMNPQIRFGEDLMSRVSYAMMNAGGVVVLIGGFCIATGQLSCGGGGKPKKPNHEMELPAKQPRVVASVVLTNDPIEVEVESHI